MQNQAPPYNSIKFLFYMNLLCSFQIKPTQIYIMHSSIKWNISIHKIFYILWIKCQQKLSLAQMCQQLEYLCGIFIKYEHCLHSWTFMDPTAIQCWLISTANYQFMCSSHIMVCVCFFIFPHFPSFQNLPFSIIIVNICWKFFAYFRCIRSVSLDPAEDIRNFNQFFYTNNKI